MMTKLLRKVKALAAMEQNEAAKNYGERFIDLHQGYGVIQQEISEAEDDMAFIDSFMRAVLRELRGDPDEETLKKMDTLERIAEHSAAEMIQVAAMARKMRKTAKRMIKENVK